MQIIQAEMIDHVIAFKMLQTNLAVFSFTKIFWILQKISFQTKQLIYIIKQVKQ